MKSLILAAGYATRMAPLTERHAKPLLPVGGKPVLDHILESLSTVRALREVLIVTNHRFHSQFTAWLDASRRGSGADASRRVITLIDDGTTSNSSRLGAIGDLALVVRQARIDDEDLLVMAGDNLFDFEINHFFEFFQEKGTDVISVHRTTDVERLRRSGNVKLDNAARVIDFVEKPAHPESCYCSPPLYIFRKETLGMVGRYIDEGNDPDAPGHFIAWLQTRRPVHAFVFEEPRYDIGTLESYREVDRIYSSTSRPPVEA